MRAHILLSLALAGAVACTDTSPVEPVAVREPTLEGMQALLGSQYNQYALRLSAERGSNSEAWGLVVVRAGLAPPNPCAPFARRLINALTICGVIYNPAFEDLQAMTFEVRVPGGVSVHRGFVSAPPNPCNIALIQGVFPVDVLGATAVRATLETAAGVIGSNGTSWPGSFPSAPSVCVLSVTLG